MTVSYARWAALGLAGAVVGGGAVSGWLLRDGRWPLALVVLLLCGAQVRTAVLRVTLAGDGLLVRTLFAVDAIPRGDVVVQRWPLLPYVSVFRRGRGLPYTLPRTRKTRELLAAIRG